MSGETRMLCTHPVIDDCLGAQIEGEGEENLLFDRIGDQSTTTLTNLPCLWVFLSPFVTAKVSSVL